ncbi:MAG: proton-conducting transporter membrane subunit [Bacillota bacterium]
MLKNLPVMVVVFLLIAGYMMPVVARWDRKKCAPFAALAMGFGVLGSVLLMNTVIASGQPITYNLGGWIPPWGIAVRIDYAESFMLMLLTGVGAFILWYASGDIGSELGHKITGWYYTAFLLLLAAMLGMAMANDLFNLYVFMEVSGICACALVAAKGDREATEAALKYLLLATIGSGFVLFGIGMLYMLTGHLNLDFVAIQMRRVWVFYPTVTWVATSFFVVGFAVKSALFPLHIWLPDAHSSAPSPSSAVLSGLVVKIYAFALMKLLYLVFSGLFTESFPVALAVRYILLVFSAMAILGGSLFALVQVDVKRLLAYSTVAQMGYIFLGIGLGSPAGLAAAMLHILNHAVMKSCLFLSAGSFIHVAGVRQVRDFTGLSKTMPWTSAAFSIAALSMIGFPPLAGFASKWYLSEGAMQSGEPVFVVLMVVSSFLNAWYYLPLVGRIYSVGEDSGVKEDIPLSMRLPVVLLAACCVVLGLFPKIPLTLVYRAVDKFLLK